jgi:hypothetical protein
MLASDGDRDRAAASLRGHYVNGRLAIDEFAERMELALGARSRAEVRTVLRDLPLGWTDLPEGIHATAARGVRLARRSVLFMVLLGVWLAVSFALLLGFGVAFVVGGLSVVTALAFPLAWLLVAYALWRVWRRDDRRITRRR